MTDIKKPIDKKKFWAIMIAIIALGLVIDQITKVIVANTLTLDDRIYLIGDFVYLTYAKNWGASFGMLRDWEYRNIVFFIITLIGVPVFIWFLGKRREDHMLGSVGFALMISGALGNAIDRFIFASTFYDGYVRDFIGVKYFAIFNVADSCMCVGIALLFISMLFLDKDSAFGKKDKATIEKEINDKKSDSMKKTSEMIDEYFEFDDDTSDKSR